MFRYIDKSNILTPFFLGDSFFGVFVSAFTVTSDSVLSGCCFGFSSGLTTGFAANIADTGFFFVIGVDVSALTEPASDFTFGILIGKTIEKPNYFYVQRTK